MTTNITRRYLKGEIPLKNDSYISILKEAQEYSVIINAVFVNSKNELDELPIKLSESEIQKIFSQIHEKIQSDYVKTELEIHKEEYQEFLEILNGVGEEA